MIPSRALSVSVLIVLIGGTTWFLYENSRPEIIYRTPVEPSTVGSSPSATDASASSAPTSVHTPEKLPASVLIEVPFASQAPLGNWGMPYQEACEEASLILVHYYLDGKTITPEEMDREIIAVTEYEAKELGYHADTTVEENGTVAVKFYGRKAEVHYDISIDDIKRELAAGNPVILPLAGRDVGNPYYNGEGPWYHMLVVIGYDSRNFITNDVGTKRGEHYKYRQDVLYDAIHDWTGAKEDIRNGRKAMLIVKK